MSKIVMVTNQFSVVVKGLEKELRRLRNEVKHVDNGFAGLSEYDYKTDVILLYLSDNLLDDMHKKKELHAVCKKVKENGCGLILIGTIKSQDQFLAGVPELKDYTWMNRPVDINELSDVIDRETEKARKLRNNRRILVVDDDMTFAMMVKSWLMDDYIVTAVTDGMQAISFIMANHVDLVLLDYEMPMVDGAQILEMLRSDTETQSTPVMFLTSIRDKESIERVIDLKPEGYILKSTSREEILKILANYFEKKSRA